ncbi:hypothetical protein E2C01_005908 [Portunus trituberculatus]|uniref:Uncharacterized protein n=1 Tax=Portunus trituberculatus TaxID=210409 RepID=A0A5B7CXU6_PORTR|nr:hypothetical protein [Portunus trituberculatus]
MTLQDVMQFVRHLSDTVEKRDTITHTARWPGGQGAPTPGHAAAGPAGPSRRHAGGPIGVATARDSPRVFTVLREPSSTRTDSQRRAPPSRRYQLSHYLDSDNWSKCVRSRVCMCSTAQRRARNEEHTAEPWAAGWATGWWPGGGSTGRTATGTTWTRETC